MDKDFEQQLQKSNIMILDVMTAREIALRELQLMKEGPIAGGNEEKFAINEEERTEVRSDSTTGNVEDSSNKKLKQDNLKEVETFAIESNPTSNTLDRSNYVRAWLENQSNLFFGLETPKLQTFSKKSEISALITQNSADKCTEKVIELGKVLEPKVFETSSIKTAENLKALSTEQKHDVSVAKEKEVRNEAAPKSCELQNVESGNWAINNKPVEEEIREVGSVENAEKEAEMSIKPLLHRRLNHIRSAVLYSVSQRIKFSSKGS
eukprot:gene4850-21179_t